MTVQLPAHLSDMINNLGTAASTLAEEVKADRAERTVRDEADRAERKRTQRRQTGLLVIVAVLVAALVGLSVSNRLLGNQNRSVIKTIESCTSDDGECAKKGRQQTADALGKLISAYVEIQACSRTERTDAGYRACVDEALADLLTAPPAGTPKTPAPPASSATPRPTPAPTVG